MTLAETIFKDVVRELIQAGTHPTPTALLRRYSRRIGLHERRRHNLNGRQVGWLREDLGVSPIRDCWRRIEMGPCRWNCCTGNGQVPR